MSDELADGRAMAETAARKLAGQHGLVVQNFRWLDDWRSDISTLVLLLPDRDVRVLLDDDTLSDMRETPEARAEVVARLDSQLR